MAIERINELPVETSPVASEVVPIDGSTTRQTTIQNLVDAGAPVASQAEAEAGVNNVKRMTALTTKQAFDAFAPIGFLRASLNLSDIPNDATARANLGLGDSSTRNVGTTAGTVAAGDDSRVVNALQPTSTIIIPANLSAAIATPPIIQNSGYRWSIFAFNGGETERAKATAIADYQATMNTALGTGEKIEFSKWEYPVRSIGGSHGVETSGLDVDVECASGAKFIAGQVFWNAAYNVLQFVGGAPTLSDSANMQSFKWKGGVCSGVQLTADNGTGTGFGNGFMNVVGFFNPTVDDVFFDGGIVTPLLNTVGAGAIDTLLGWNQNVGGRVQGCGFRGAYDVALYGIGWRLVSTLANNPITTTSIGSAVATVAATAHGMRNGDRCHLKGITTTDGVVFADGEYAVSGVATNTFQVSGTSGVAVAGSTAGGGAAVVFTNSKTNKRAFSILGESSLFIKNWFTRCTSSIAMKRNMRSTIMAYNTFREVGNGIGTSGVGEYEGGDGKRMKIFGNDFFNVMNWPIRLQGGGPETLISLNTIENFGRQIYDDGATAVNLSSGFPLAGIQIDSMDAAKIINNTIRMTDVFSGATWIASEEPAAIRLDRNTDYTSGCVDCEVDGNTIIDVPQPYNDSATGLRTRIGKKNFVRGSTKASVYGSTGAVLETNKQLSAPSNSLAAAGSAAINVAHGLDFTPPKAACSVDFGSASGATVMTGITAQITATDATNVTVTLNNPTAQAGKVLDLYVKITLG